MSEAYLIATSTGPVQIISGTSRSEQVRPILEAIIKKTGIPAQEIEEIHWIGGHDEFWLASVEPPDRQVARFHWPSSPLLAQFVLQSCGRAIEAGERHLLLLAQEAEGQAVVMMLASPSAVGRFNFTPLARIGLRLSFSSSENNLVDVRAAMEKNKLDPDNVKWLVSVLRHDPQSSSEAFPSAQWLCPEDGEGLPSGDLFLLEALSRRLEKKQLALLLNNGQHHSGLGTLVERI